MGHVCSCVKLDLNLDGGHLPLGIFPWQGIGNFSGVILPFGCLVDFYPIAPKVRRDRKGGVQNAQNDFRHAGKIDSEDVDEGRDHWIANEDEKVLTRVHVEARTELFIPIGANCPVRIKDFGRRRSTVLNYLDGSTEFVVDENWLQDENDRGGNHEWTGETHFDCDFDQIDEDEAEIYDNEEYEPECNDGPDLVPIDEVEVEETSVTTALPAEKKERDFIKIEEDPKFAPSSKPGLFLGYRLEPGGLWKGDYLVADLEHIQRGLRKPSIHQVKRIWKNPEKPYVFPMLASYDARTRTIREAIADRRADLKPSKKIGDEFDFDEVDSMILMMMTMTNRTRGAVALPNLMGSFRARLSKGVVTHASQITGSGTTRTAHGTASTLRCGRSSSGRRTRTFLQVVLHMRSLTPLGSRTCGGLMPLEIG